MKVRFFLPLLVLVFFMSFPETFADPTPGGLVLKTEFNMWEVNLRPFDLLSNYEKSTFRNIPVSIPEDKLPIVAPYIQHQKVKGVDIIKLQDYLERRVSPLINREKEDVKIDLDIDNKVVFTGRGLYGRSLDLKKAAFVLKEAIEKEIAYVHLPILRTEPIVSIPKKLQEKGIFELVSSGETDFTGSPVNRINNVKVGLARFNGTLIAPGEEFVFGNVLGEVDASMGYKKELVIKGDRTVPEYGGGLCQVSTTVYRAILYGGFPITQRKNHTYAVQYYKPIGLDATVYPPTIDLKFVNDSPGHLLMQTFTMGTRAYTNLYGTKDNRKVRLIGPYYYNRTPAPPPRTEYTTKLAPGEKEVLGHAVPGLGSSWYRQVTYADPEKPVYFESIHSKYQARPDFVAIGVAEGQETPEGKSLIETTY